MADTDSPPIPPILDSELIAAVSALAKSAQVYRTLLYKILDQQLAALTAEERGTYPAVQLLLEEENNLNLADRVINAWREQLGTDDV